MEPKTETVPPGWVTFTRFWFRDNRWIILTIFVAASLHIVANLISVNGWLLPPGLWDYWAGQPQDRWYNNNQLRISLGAHAIAWILHSLLWDWVCGRTKGLRRAPWWQVGLEILAFVPVPVMLWEVIKGFEGQVLMGYTIDLFTAPDVLAQYTILLVSAPSIFVLTRMRADPSYEKPDDWYILAFLRSKFGMIMGGSAMIPMGETLTSTFGPIGELFFFICTLYIADRVALTFSPQLTLQPIRKWDLPILAIGITIWGFMMPGVFWSLPVLTTRSAIHSASRETGISEFNLMKAWLQGRVRGYTVVDYKMEDEGFCLQVDCTDDCEQFMIPMSQKNVVAMPGNYGVSMSLCGRPEMQRNTNCHREFPFRSIADPGDHHRYEAESHACNGFVEIAYEYHSLW